VKALGGQVIFAHAGAGVAAVSGLDDARAGQIAARSDVAAVDADMMVELDEPATETAQAVQPESPANPATAFFYPRQWNMRAIGADRAWAAGKLGSPEVTVGILDTGIDYRSPDLAGLVNLPLSKSFLSKAENDRVQRAFPGAHEVADLHYHGTHVAATVASNGLVAAGVTSRVTLVGLKVCAPGSPADNWRGSCPTSGTLAAILYAADHGIGIINMSLGGAFTRAGASARGGDAPSFLATVNQVMNYATRKGTTIIVAAGNSAFDLDHHIIPTADGAAHIPGLYASYCDAPAVICVSATGPTAQAGVNGPWQNVDAFAAYSNFGRSAVDVAAPGGNASSVWASCSSFSLAFPICQTGAYVLGAAGTSMATPHVAGVAALIASDGVRQPSQIQARLQQTADDLGQPGIDPYYGKGRVNAARAVGVE
jgi:subtilisin family serine protease